MCIRIKLLTYGGDIRNWKTPRESESRRLSDSPFQKDTFRQQGATGTGIVFGLHAAHTMNETMSYGDFNKNPFYADK